MNLKEQIENFNLDKSEGIDNEDKDVKRQRHFHPTVLS